MFLVRTLPLLAIVAFALFRFRRHEAAVIREYALKCPGILPYIEGEEEELTDEGRRWEILAQFAVTPWSRECRARYQHFKAVSQLAFLRRNVRRHAVPVTAWSKAQEQRLIHKIRDTQ